MGRSTDQPFIPSWNASTPTCCVGSVESTNDCGARRKPERRGTEPSGHDQVPSPTGPGSPTAPPSGDQNDESRITRDRYVRFCEGPGVKSPGLLGGLGRLPAHNFAINTAWLTASMTAAVLL